MPPFALTSARLAGWQTKILETTAQLSTPYDKNGTEVVIMNQSNAPVAVITGASSGIGHAVASRLATQGYRLCLTARREGRLEALAATLSETADVILVTADMRQDADIDHIFQRVSEKWGRLDVLINSAGLGRNAPLLDGPASGWREMFDVNVIGLSIATQQAVALMRQSGDSGQVIHISSMSGHRVPSGTGAMYSATKYAVRALTEGLRRELRQMGSGIRVCAISPGFVETEFAEVMSGCRDKAQATYSRFKCLTADDIADSVEWVLSTPSHMQVHDILMRPTEQES